MWIRAASSVWTPPSAPAPGQIPTSAHFDYHYEMDRKQFELAPGEIITPSSRIQFRGALSMVDSSLDVTVDTDDLTGLGRFHQSPARDRTRTRKHFGGHFHWQGRLTGRLDGPTFAGHVKGTDARYGALYWDELEGELTYSPDELHLATRPRAPRPLFGGTGTCARTRQLELFSR